MTDDHFEPRAEFPISILYGAIGISVVLMTVLTVSTFVMGGHGTTNVANNAPAATQQKR